MVQKSDGSSGYNAPLLYKAFSLLEEVAANQSKMGISDLSRQLNISKGTISGITRALTGVGALHLDPATRKFRLGSTLVKLGSLTLSGVNPRAVARSFMEELSRKHQETIFLGVFDKHQGITLIESIVRPGNLKITAQPGTIISQFAGAPGKVFLSCLPTSAVRNILKKNKLPRFTEKSITNQADYLNELKAVRQNGYATDFEEYLPGLNGISVPVWDSRGRVIGALWLVGTSYSFTGKKLEQAISSAMHTANQISTELGIDLMRISHKIRD